MHTHLEISPKICNNISTSGLRRFAGLSLLSSTSFYVCLGKLTIPYPNICPSLFLILLFICS